MYYLEDEVLNLVIEYDVNGDGTIDFDEFLEMMKKQAEHQEYSRIKQLFLVQGCNLDATSDKAPLRSISWDVRSFMGQEVHLSLLQIKFLTDFV